MDQFSYEVNGKHILVYRSIYEPLNSNMFTILSNNEAIVFDPNIDNDLLALFRKNGIKKAHILLTHGHYDHISGVEWLKENIKATVYCHVKCAERLANSKRPISRLVALVLATEDKKDGGHRYKDFVESYKPFTIKADRTFEESGTLVLGDLKIEFTHTPGHSEGSTCYKLSDGMVFTGDTFLQENETITRFPGGNTDDYNNVALPFLRSLPKDTIIMPGHGNPFVLEETNNYI